MRTYFITIHSNLVKIPVKPADLLTHMEMITIHYPNSEWVEGQFEYGSKYHELHFHGILKINKKIDFRKNKYKCKNWHIYIKPCNFNLKNYPKNTLRLMKYMYKNISECPHKLEW